jgi:esterase/lipase superfamily enzyme
MICKACLCLIVSSLFLTTLANGQGHCQAVQQDSSIDELQARVKSLQTELTSLKTSAPGTDDSPAIRKTQERLLVASEELECRQEGTTLSEKGILTASSYVQVPLLYVTDRQRAAPDHGVDFYTSQASTVLEFGKVNAIINEIGTIRTGMISGANRVAAPKSLGKAQLQQPQPLSQQAFTELLAPAHSSREPLRILLFVHGFNVEFYEAALSVARLATSMQIPLVPVFYSWPSKGEVLGYWHDEDEVSAAVIRFSPFLERLLSTPGSEVVIVCHSMGARIVARALGELARKKARLGSLKNVVFAAADVNVEELNAEWPYLKQIPGVQWASYESSGDFALRLSTYIHRFRRVGESDGGVSIEEGMSTIDASSTTSVIRTFGHSYIISSPSLAGDIGDWVAQDLPPAIRGLQRMTQGTAVYWRFP